MEKKWKKYWFIYVVLVMLVGGVFYVGVFNNPAFDIHDFCMGLSTEIVGAVIALVLIDRYATLKIARREEIRARKALSCSNGKEESQDA